MRRKQICLLLALSWQAAAQDPVLRGGNILASETYSYRDLIRAGKLDMLTVPEFYKQQGIPGISYNDMFFKTVDDAFIDEVKAAVRKAGRVVTCYVIEGNLAVADEGKRRAQIEADKRKMRAAARLGAPVVRINVGSTGAENADNTAGVDRIIRIFNEELVPLAKELKIRISMENHGGVSKTAENIVKIIQATDPKWVGALVDFGNFPPEVRYEEVAKVAPYAFVTHVKVNVFDEKGEAAEYDFPRVLGMLKKNHYRGPISIEYEGKGDPVEGVRQTKALILKYW
ncbi:MAG TPA: sugar phosphate isomerase/epimerase family protein [Bryobacteraceae bacterium]|jgi:sugar phosphate isomerase/epimerase|nr:sugar phosphate isomerase/epimerase family protein [Bryobacteraceae bacterium]